MYLERSGMALLQGGSGPGGSQAGFYVMGLRWLSILVGAVAGCSLGCHLMATTLNEQLSLPTMQVQLIRNKGFKNETSLERKLFQVSSDELKEEEFYKLKFTITMPRFSSHLKSITRFLPATNMKWCFPYVLLWLSCIFVSQYHWIYHCSLFVLSSGLEVFVLLIQPFREHQVKS